MIHKATTIEIMSIIKVWVLVLNSIDFLKIVFTDFSLQCKTFLYAKLKSFFQTVTFFIHTLNVPMMHCEHIITAMQCVLTMAILRVRMELRLREFS